jgi:hypothetical protein
MNAAQVRTEEATNTRNGFTGDFSDFVIASYLDGERAMTAEGAEAPVLKKPKSKNYQDGKGEEDDRPNPIPNVRDLRAHCTIP